MSIASQLNEIKTHLPASVKLVAVSKFHAPKAILKAYNEGQRIFGESRVQELLEKKDHLPDDIQWHFIGHLQRNKVKEIVPFVSLIQGVDSTRLLREINKRGSEIGRKINCLLQIHIAEESSKFGFSFEECRELLKSDEWHSFSNIQICGVMGMATYTENKEQVKKEFQALSNFFQEIKNDFFANDTLFTEISMGMSDDYEIAIAEGSTLIRIGTAVFGEREY